MKNYIALFFYVFFLTTHFSFSQSRKVNELKKEYIESALHNISGEILPVLKWENKETLKYYISGKFEFISKKEWTKFLKKIEFVTGFRIIPTEKFSDADIHLYFGELTDYFKTFNIRAPQQLVSKFDNWSSRKYNRNRQLTLATYCIVPSKTKTRNRGSYNLKKLFLKSLGMLGESKDKYSLFYKYQTDGNRRLSKTDKRILKIHYDDILKSGMKLTEVKDLLNSKINLNKIIKEKL
ncbi:MAG: DUF2927 domain-containing protein [Flavobacteriaceae bacterium]|nr:DUF2927 domain-containing protein [Flavobacteriaceae bacterium]